MTHVVIQWKLTLGKLDNFNKVVTCSGLILDTKETGLAQEVIMGGI